MRLGSADTSDPVQGPIVPDAGIAAASADELSTLAAVGRHALRADAVALLLEIPGQPPRVAASTETPALGEEALAEARAHLGQPQGRPPLGNGHASLCLTISHSGQAIGALAALRAQGPGFAPEDWETAGIVGWQAALVAERAREAERTVGLMAALARVETYSAAESTETGHHREEDVVREARGRLGYQGGALYLQEDGRPGFRLTVREGVAPADLPEMLEQPPGPLGPAVDGTNLHATPLTLEWGERLRGFLILFADPAAGRTHPFGPVTLELIASRVAASLGTVRLIQAEREQRKMAEALQEASLAIDRELNLNEVLDRILEQVMRAFPCDSANFMSYEGTISRSLRWRGYEQFGLSDEDMAEVVLDAARFENLGRMSAGEAVTIPDTTADPSWVFNPRFEWLRSWAGVPVRYGETILGFVMLDSATPGTFDEGATHRLMAFAAHAGAAMHNARLYNRLVREHTRLQQVHSIGRTFSGSLARDEILDRLGIAVREALGGETWTVFVPGSQAAHFEPLDRASDAFPTADDQVWISRVGEAFTPDLRIHKTSAGPMTQVAFPLTSGDRTHAVAVVGLHGSLAEPESWLDVLRPVGQQAGLALANAEEHAIVQRRLAELTALQSIVRHIASRLEVDAVLREVTQQLNANIGFPVVQVYMVVGDHLELRQHNGPTPIVPRIGRNQGIVGRAARERRAQLVPDVRKDPDYIAGLVGTRAEAAVPIITDDTVIGVVNVETSDPSQLDREALELLRLLADQLSIAIQNASLFESAQTSLETLEGRVRERTAQLEQVLEQALAAERVKAQFVADVSHELRTPLTNIGLYLDLLDLSDDGRRNEYMATLRRETDRLGRLIDQLLAMSHLDTGQAELRLVETDLNALVKVLLGDRARMIARKGLKLEMKPDPELPLVEADPQYLMQVMTNLLSNAVNYTPEGGRITIETSLANWQDSIYATLTVRDTGQGIPDEEQQHVFERFYRGLGARASGVSGTGLGLAISREIMNRHGGRLTLYSRAGAGAAFTIWLPLIGRPAPC
ncbi:MAG TPA: GAF domain-containing protein [Anaerolineales bacterium]|nr:GAF domain-containing protein [Anaerolineales bacterium]